MFIQTETTPNPNTLKFIPGQEVSLEKNYQFNSKEDARISPMASSLFKTVGVTAVFLGSDFISITKTPTVSWDIIKADLLSKIMDNYASGKPIIVAESEQTQSVSAGTNLDDEITKQIIELIETRVRPAVANDGGDIIFRGFEDGVVKLELHGACSGCPSSSVTLKNGIENMLKYYVPEVESVEAVNEGMDSFD